jgi:succinyl-diaminopimelate desuccinylase
LVVEIEGSRPGPTWLLDACLDTAPWGDTAAWSFSPAAGDVVDGWLRGRGSADSKGGAAMFCHLAAHVAEQAEELGSLAVLLDVDEHTGGFGGARAYLHTAGHPVAGAMIGYPGLDEVVVGGRGVYRTQVHIYGISSHSGSSRPADANAVVRAAWLVAALEEASLPAVVEGGFPLPGKVTVTAIHGGEGYTAVPDQCTVAVDIRLTDTLDARAAEKLLQRAATDLDAAAPHGVRATVVEPVLSWPPFALADHDQPAAALLAAARAIGLEVRPKVAGPSNIGNLLAGQGIPATCGFGLAYEGLHGTDERVRLADLPRVQAAYTHAVFSLLSGG